MTWDNKLTSLNEILAGLYPTIQESYRILDAAGLKKSHIAFQAKPIDNWHAILVEALRRDSIEDILSGALRDYPENQFLIELEKRNYSPIMGPVVGQDLPWIAHEPSENLEKLMGSQSTLLPISFLALGLERARSVARVVLPGGYGTGFLTTGNLFITNHHVIATHASAETAVIQFNYQKTATGLDQAPVEFRLDPLEVFSTSETNDWTICKISGDANKQWGSIPITPIQARKNDRVIIIQHPAGGQKAIAFYHNLVTYADPTAIQYLTDTLPGSSGSPVFNDHWQLVAIHHSGGYIREPGCKDLVFRNEGIPINQIVSPLNNLHAGI